MAVKKAVFGGGCFWCMEAVFQELKGVSKVESGYAGGHVKNPSYQDVCEGTSGHAEVCQIYFDSEIISFEKLLEIFWKVHDPTTLNRQGSDVGTQYRSIILYHDEEQRDLSQRCCQKLEDSGILQRKIITQIEAFTAFYPAEAEHQNYYRRNPEQSYCRFIIQPKIEKLTAFLKKTAQ